ncbi:MAG: CHAD domain-containing protein [Burkholderiales bacterium]|nr:CHAD domain-containing protein [Burkholderiales bacterium]MDR4517582.1 CHAD domain-containing protein [Nitrosomonas sp.]
MEPIHSAQFILRQETDIDSVFELLRQKYSLQETGSMQLERHYLDTFDWRMYRKNYLCGWDVPVDTNNTNREGVFFVRYKETGDCIYEFPLSAVPRFSRELAHPICRKLLDDIVGVRALMTMATIMIERRQSLLLNEDNKTLVILQVENYTIHDQADKNQLATRLLVYPIRGYKKAFRHVRHTLTSQMKLPCVNTALLDEVLTATRQKPDFNQFVLTPRLEGLLNTWEAVQILLRHLLSAMQANEPGLRAAIDTEFLHDYRVALRRTRSILGQIKHVLPDRLLAYFKRELLWLSTMTTPTRDLDIYLLKFDDYRQELPAEFRHDLEPFRLFLLRHWKIEHARLCRALDTKRYQRLINKWQQIVINKNERSKNVTLQKTSPAETLNAAEPARRVAGQRIWKLYNRVLKEGGAITLQSPDEALHELRKTCKRFRYLIEFFHDYYSDKQIKELIKTLKQLQDNLGDFQDLCVQLEQLKAFAEQMRQEDMAGTKTIMAMGVLVEKLNARKVLVRAEFNQRFKMFGQAENKSAFVRALSPRN